MVVVGCWLLVFGFGFWCLVFFLKAVGSFCSHFGGEDGGFECFEGCFLSSSNVFLEYPMAWTLGFVYCRKRLLAKLCSTLLPLSSLISAKLLKVEADLASVTITASDILIRFSWVSHYSLDLMFLVFF